MKLAKLENNIWQYFVYTFSQRRHFIPLLSIFFLTLPNTTAQQIGLYTGIGFIASLLIEIPSSYFADRIGHKSTLVMAKIFMIISTLLFIFADGFWYFAFGSAFLSLSFASSGGVGSAFMHNTLRDLKREKDYTKLMSRIGAYASLFSGILIVLLPFLTTKSILLPFKITLVIDIIGLAAVCALTVPSQKRDKVAHSLKEIGTTLRYAVKRGFYPLAFFTSAISGFLVADAGYRYVYLQSLGYPIIFIGAVMGFSRFVWFIIAHYIEHIQKIPLRLLITIEVFLFPLSYILIARFDNPYIVGVFFSLIVGYHWARDPIYTAQFINNYIKNKKYKATMLSIATQVDYLFQMAVGFSIAFVMGRSYKLGFYTLGFSLFFVLILIYIWMYYEIFRPQKMFLTKR
jgi:MFS family permease